MARVLCLGEILIDRIQGECYPGGAPLNVACALARLGTPVSLMGGVGHDQAGQFLLQTLDARGVDRSGVKIHPTAPTREVLVNIDASGERSFGGSRGDADTYLGPNDLPESLFSRSAFLVLGTFPLASPESSRAVARAIQYAEEHYLRLVVDVNWRPLFWPDPAIAPKLIGLLLEHTDFLKLSAEEAQWLFRTTNPQRIGQKIPHLEAVLVTHGRTGTDYWIGEHGGHCPAFMVDTVDTTGAGDGFLAGFVHQLAHQGLGALTSPAKIDAMVQYASALGALTTLGKGAIACHPDQEAIQALLNRCSS